MSKLFAMHYLLLHFLRIMVTCDVLDYSNNDMYRRCGTINGTTSGSTRATKRLSLKVVGTHARA